MPIIDCPSDFVQGPVKTASDGALGLTPAAAIRNARDDAFEEADEEVLDEIEDNYECRSGCRLIIGAPLRVGVFRQKGPPKRAWWTLFIAFWAEGSISVTRPVRCAKSSE